MRTCKVAFTSIILATCLLLCSSCRAATSDEQTTSCDKDVPHADHPHAILRNKQVVMMVFLPDSQNGYYRSSRFDWSGVIACAAYSGHTFWGEWFSKYDPYLNDAITGPVEEFRSADGGLGFAEAQPGGLFVKIGVGVLRRDNAAPYQFGHYYPMVDGGHWQVHTRRRSIRFEQQLRSPTGVSYNYTKVVELDRNGAVISLRHSLKNLGSAPIVTDVYDHDFFMLDHQSTGPGMQITFPFVPHPDESLAPAAVVEGNAIVYKQPLEPRQTVAAYLTGYSTAIRDYDIKTEDTVHHFGIEQTADKPIAKLYLWSIPTTISPEAYIHLDIAPGHTATWTLHYHLFKTAANAGGGQ